MTVELWIGQEFATTHERKALDHFLADMKRRFGQSHKLYLVLANYYVDGRQIDLTVLKKDALIIIELKECAGPFRATENGVWRTIPDDKPIGTGEQNPFEQAKDYRFRWINLLQRQQQRFLPAGKAQSMDFYHVSAFVAISPALDPHYENHLPSIPWFRLVGLDGLSGAVQQQTSRKLHFSNQELRGLVIDVLNLRQVDASLGQPVSDQTIESGQAGPGSLKSGHRIHNQIGRYKIIKLLGQGRMGQVYLAHDPALNREVVLKLITLSDPTKSEEWRQRFRREVQATAKLNHPHIVTIHDVDLEHEPPYMVMELLTGDTLEKRLASGPLSWREALRMLRPLAEALACAHQAGVIHRDVNPANIMFAGAEMTTLKLVDFGVAHWQDGARLTQTGAVVGATAYMSPEQAQGEEVDGRADIFAWGIILFEALTGCNPLDKGSASKTLLETISDTPIDTTSLIDKAPHAVISLVERAVAKDRQQRYPTCEALLVDLDHCLSDLLNTLAGGMLMGQAFQASPGETSPPLDPTPLMEIESPYGTMRPDSQFYIERTADDICMAALRRSTAATLFIQAPRQMGKSSLLRRMIYRIDQAQHKKSAFIDLQEFPGQHFNDEKSFILEFCLAISNELGIPPAIEPYWQGPQTDTIKCRFYLSDYIIPQVNAPFILAMDELDRLLGCPFRDNFFGMLRAWHNYRARDENFAKLTLLLSSSTEPYLFIENPHQSPFNVAEVITLQDFTEAEVAELNRRHHSTLDEGQVGQLMDLAGGHPFLTRLALYLLVTNRIDLATLLARATEDTGPFGEHLRYYLLHILEKPELKQGLIDISRDQMYEENQIFHRLKGAGLVKKVGPQVVFRNNLYTRYFKERLHV